MKNVVTYRRELRRSDSGSKLFYTLLFHLQSYSEYQEIDIEWSVAGKCDSKELIGGGAYEALQKLKAGDVEVGDYTVSWYSGRQYPLKSKISELVHPPDCEVSKDVLEILSAGLPTKVLAAVNKFL